MISVEFRYILKYHTQNMRATQFTYIGYKRYHEEVKIGFYCFLIIITRLLLDFGAIYDEIYSKDYIM